MLATGYSLPATSYAYDAASRLSTVTQGANTATYGYVPNSPLVGAITFAQSGTTRLATTKTYDNLNRLSGISSVPSASSAVSAAYTYNSANQRTKATREDNTYWNYHYDALGQVTSGKKFDATNTALNGLDYAWTFDDIGNRKSATTNSQISNYTSNNLNQYAQRTVPGIIDAFGAADAAATVTVALNGGAPQPTARQGELFFKQFTVDNSAVAQRPSLKITGVKNLVGPGGEDALTEITKTPYLPKTPEVFTYDADGNLTDDARWHYTWDAENRLVAMVPSAVGGALRPDSLRLEFSYDGQGRRISKNVYNWNGTAWVLGTSTRFLHDGWNLLAELNALNSNSVVCTYVWGADLSGSLQGAGGVGGLLFCNSSLVSGPSTFSLCYDGNGNVIGLVDMATGTKSATYDYNAFGETIQSDGVASVANHFRFSTKYQDDETGLNYYGYRFYDPRSGRFLGRDPIQENGGINLYAFVANNGISHFDPLGLIGETGIGGPVPPPAIVEMPGETPGEEPSISTGTPGGYAGLTDGLLGNPVFSPVGPATGSYGGTTSSNAEFNNPGEPNSQSPAGRAKAYEKIQKEKAALYQQVWKRGTESCCPTLKLSSASMPKITAFIQRVMLLHPMPLHKGLGQEMADLNRKDALKDFRRLSKWSRDEYPFASTLEGGESASREYVPIEEQWIQGGVIGAFYSANKMKPGDCFFVQIVP